MQKLTRRRRKRRTVTEENINGNSSLDAILKHLDHHLNIISIDKITYQSIAKGTLLGIASIKVQYFYLFINVII